MRARYICAVHVGHAGRRIIGLFSGLYWVNVIRGSLFAGGSTGTLSHRRLTECVSAMCFNMLCSPVELCKTAHFRGQCITHFL
jgi:hypothetical protein